MSRLFTRCKWFRNTGFLIDIADELFYITNKDGNRHYHLLNVGLQEIKDQHNKAVILVVTVVFVQLGIGRILK